MVPCCDSTQPSPASVVQPRWQPASVRASSRVAAAYARTAGSGIPAAAAVSATQRRLTDLRRPASRMHRRDRGEPRRGRRGYDDPRDLQGLGTGAAEGHDHEEQTHQEGRGRRDTDDLTHPAQPNRPWT